MSRIIIFGDSFATKCDNDYGWTNKLAKNFNAEQVNYAVGGSSIEYSLYNLTNYLKNDYQQEDKIIFVATNPSRSPIIHADYNPKWACFYKVNKNNEYYKTVMKYTDQHIDKYKYFLITSILNSITNDCFLICAFDNCIEKSKRNNFIISNFCLGDIAIADQPEPNHLSVFNHDVMAELTFQSIITRNDLFDKKHFEKTNNKKIVDKKLWSNWLSPNL